MHAINAIDSCKYSRSTAMGRADPHDILVSQFEEDAPGGLERSIYIE